MRRRLLFSYLSLTLFILLVLEVPLAITFARGERRALTTRVERDTVALASFAEGLLEGEATEDIAILRSTANGYRDDTGGRVVVVDRAGISLLDTAAPDATRRDFSTRPEVVEALGGDVATGTRSSNTLGANLLYVAVPVASGGTVFGAVRVTYPTTAVDERVHRYWLVLAGIGAIVIAAASLVAVRFSRTIVRPLSDLEAAAQAAGEGDLTVRAPVDGPPEVRTLASRFNEMIAQLDELLSSQSAFVADASHQLRTPLASLRLRLENLQHDVADPGQPGLASALTEVERLSQLVDQLLALARADGAGLTPATTIDLSSVIDERAEFWAALADEQAVELIPGSSPSVLARAAQGRIEQVVDNLIENALEACDAGGTVTITCKSDGAWAELRIEDDGPGLTAHQRDRAFDRFWRAQSSGEGSGLGLAIVDRLVALDAGTVELAASARGGVAAIVRLPIANSREPGL
jgi:signal transduction histidine kinase